MDFLESNEVSLSQPDEDEDDEEEEDGEDDEAPAVAVAPAGAIQPSKKRALEEPEPTTDGETPVPSVPSKKVKS